MKGAVFGLLVFLASAAASRATVGHGDMPF